MVADNFESGLGWWTINRTGDAAVTTQSQTVHAGGCAARITVSASGSSLGNMTRAFPAGTREAWSDGWFDFEAQGASTSWNAPTFRFFSNGKRVLDVSRQNGSGSMFVRYPNGSGGWTILQTGQYPALRRWYHLKIHVLANGNASTVEVWLDGSRIFATTDGDARHVGPERADGRRRPRRPGGRRRDRRRRRQGAELTGAAAGGVVARSIRGAARRGGRTANAIRPRT